MSQKTKTRFINLAAQLASQNESVGQTMDSLLASVIQQHNAGERSDWHEVKKTMDKLKELKKLGEPAALRNADQDESFPKPKLARQTDNNREECSS